MKQDYFVYNSFIDTQWKKELNCRNNRQTQANTICNCKYLEVTIANNVFIQIIIIMMKKLYLMTLLQPSYSQKHNFKMCCNFVCYVPLNLRASDFIDLCSKGLVELGSHQYHL